MDSLLSLAVRPLASRLLRFEGANFSTPVGEPSIVTPDSVSWRVFSNVVSVYVGGVAAVLMEFGEPRVRAGVWDYSSFRDDPRGRMHSTGGAAMVTVFGARSEFERLAERVNRIHTEVSGRTAEGAPYRADDPDLLLWVHATASYAFLNAYTRLVQPLSAELRDRFYAEGALGGRLYRVEHPPRSEAELEQMFERAAPRLDGSEVVGEFLQIMRTGAILPLPLRPLQRLIVRGAIALVPSEIRSRLGIPTRAGATASQLAALRGFAKVAARVHIPSSPWALAAKRLGLPPDYVRRNPSPASSTPRRS